MTGYGETNGKIGGVSPPSFDSGICYAAEKASAMGNPAGYGHAAGYSRETGGADMNAVAQLLSVVEGAIVKCNQGENDGTLKSSGSGDTKQGGKVALTIEDTEIEEENFGKCKKRKEEDDETCIPKFQATWDGGDTSMENNGITPLNRFCKLTCTSEGGIITVENSGQGLNSEEIMETLKDLGEKAGLVFDKLGAVIQDIDIDGLIASIAASLAGVGAALATTVVSVNASLASVGTAVGSAFVTVKTSLSKSVNRLKDSFDSILSRLKNSFSNTWDSLKNSFNNTWDSLKNQASNAWDRMKDTWSKIQDSIENSLKKDSGVDFSKPKHYLDYALNQQGLDKIPEKLKQKWTYGGYNYEVRVHPGDPKYTNAETIYRVARKAKPVPGKQGSGMEYMDKNGKWWHQSELREFNGDGTLNPLFNHDAAKNTHIPVD